MSSTLKIIDLNAVWEGNLEAISHFLCGSGHVISKHAHCVSELDWQAESDLRTGRVQLELIPLLSLHYNLI